VDEYSVALPVAHRAGIKLSLRQKGVAMKSIPDGEEVAGVLPPCVPRFTNCSG